MWRGDFYVAGGVGGTSIDASSRSSTAATWLCRVGLVVQHGHGVSPTQSARSGAVYVGGTFTTLISIARHRVAKLNGTYRSFSWNPNAGRSGVRARGRRYLRVIGGQTRSHIAKLAGTGTGAADASWNPTANNTVYALVRDAASPLYAGGAFTSIGGRSRSHLAKLAAAAPAARTRPGIRLRTGDVRAVALDSTGAGPRGRRFPDHVRGGSHQRLAKLSPTGAGAAIASWNASASDIVYARTLRRRRQYLRRRRVRAYRRGKRLCLRSFWRSVATFSADAEVGGYGIAFAVQPDSSPLVGGNFRKAGRTCAVSPCGGVDARSMPALLRSPTTKSTCCSRRPTVRSTQGGLFQTIGGVARTRLAKLGSNGAVDPSWNPSPSA